MTNEPIEVLLKAGGKEVHTSQNEDADNDMGDLMGEDEDKSLHLKGQMLFMAEWGVIMFLSSPILTDMDSLNVNGLFVNDLPMHDFSRDLLFVGMCVISISYVCNSYLEYGSVALLSHFAKCKNALCRPKQFD